LQPHAGGDGRRFSGCRRTPRLHPGITQEVAPNERQRRINGRHRLAVEVPRAQGPSLAHLASPRARARPKLGHRDLGPDSLDANVCSLRCRGPIWPANDFVVARLVSERSPIFNSIGNTRVSAGGSCSRFFLGRLAIHAVGKHYKCGLVSDSIRKQMPVISSLPELWRARCTYDQVSSVSAKRRPRGSWRGPRRASVG
jgi:hypothetical protein